MDTPPQFRVHRLKNGLTYSCPINANQHPFLQGRTPLVALHYILDQLEQKHGPLVQYIISHELHANGKSHFHCFYKTAQKMNTIDPLFFDINGVHPNILNPQKAWIDYCAKKGEYISNFYKPPLWKRTEDLPITEALKLVEQERPDLMLTNYDRVKASLTSRKRARDFAWFQPAFDTFTTTLTFPIDPPAKCVHVYGPPRMGKSQFVYHTLRDKKFVVLGSSEEMRSPNIPWDEVEVIVFDDWEPKTNFSHSPASVIRLLERERECTVPARYTDITNMHKIPKIFISNARDIFYDPATCDIDVQEAINSRLYRVHVPFKLFGAPLPPLTPLNQMT